MNPTKPTAHIPEAAQAIIDALRAGSELRLRDCARCEMANRIARGADCNPPVASEFVLVRECICVLGAAVVPLTEDAVVSFVLRSMGPRAQSTSVMSPMRPHGPPAHEAVGHLYFDVDSVSCSVCGGSEPFSFKSRAPFKTVMRTIDAIVDLHPESPHTHRASL